MAERFAITLDGRLTEVEAGSTVAAALWSAGHWAFRRSVVGEPRGPLCGMGVCFECRVTIDGRPHRRSCLESVRRGMEVRTGG
jgi:D-hydroxyproline dehydrogenase subunit gamma